MSEVDSVARGWDRYLSDRDRQVLALSGWAGRTGLGKRPALVIVDVTYEFCGREREPIESSVNEWPNSCGAEAWSAVDQIVELRKFFHNMSMPVIYTTRQEPGDGPFFEGRWKEKNPRLIGDDKPDDRNLIVDEIEPDVQDIVIEKMKPSAFYGTPLIGYLNDLGIDSLIVCGTTTSGCVRATVVDAASLNYRVSVIEDATFDRFEASHWIGLFDMDCKYADILTKDAFISQARSTFREPFDLQLLEGSIGGQQRRVKARLSAVGRRARNPATAPGQ